MDLCHVITCCKLGISVCCMHVFLSCLCPIHLLHSTIVCLLAAISFVLYNKTICIWYYAEFWFYKVYFMLQSLSPALEIQGLYKFEYKIFIFIIFNKSSSSIIKAEFLVNKNFINIVYVLNLEIKHKNPRNIVCSDISLKVV